VNRPKSIKSRIVAFAILATVVPSLGLGALALLRIQSIANANVAFELRTLNNSVRSELTLWCHDRIQDLRALAGANTIVEGLAAIDQPTVGARGIGTREIELYLRSVRDRLGSLLELTLFDNSGRWVASTASMPAPLPVAVPRPQRSTNEGAIAVAARWDSMRSTATFAVSVPVLAPGSAPLGVLSASLDLGGLLPRLRRIVKEASGAEIVLLDPDGRPVLGTRGTGATLAPIRTASLEALLARPGEALTYVGHRRTQVVGLVGLVDAPASQPIAVAAERDIADVNRDRRRLIEQCVALVGALTLLVGAIGHRIAHSIVTPLDALADAAGRIAAGDLALTLRSGDDAEVGRLTRAFNTMVERLRRSRAKAQRARRALQRQNRLLAGLSITDALTGLANRKRLDAVLAEQLELSRRTRRTFAVVMLDLDHFKTLNDTQGHLAGDRVLASVGGALKRCIRTVDHAARYGGEEFVVVLVEPTLQGALETAERIRAEIEALRVSVGDRLLSVTASVGVAQCRDDDARPEDILARADSALYEAKDGGRNRVCAR